MKSIKQYQKEIDLLSGKRDNKETLDDLKRLKIPAVRPKFDYAFINFWKDGDDDSRCDVELNRRESEILRRFLYTLKKRSLD